MDNYTELKIQESNLTEELDNLDADFEAGRLSEDAYTEERNMVLDELKGVQDDLRKAK